ncbi:MAG: class I SAM-dependent methyltransferase [Myxococcales bacterium]|nr:class I SAM-dependent methyltransferase [Myxococcales bacterium]
MTDAAKEAVRAHWDATPCGTRDLSPDDRRAFFRELEDERYALEPYIKPFARFWEGRDKDVLEVGVGAGTDFMQWVRAGARATGVDLTAQGVALTQERLALEGLSATVTQGDAEALPFDDARFDIVYSYGVLHHSPNTPRAIDEVYRVLKPGGRARVMIYHLYSWVAVMKWAMHGAAKGRPQMSLREAVHDHLESPGTKAYTVPEARALFGRFRDVAVRTQLGHGDLLLMRPSERYPGRAHQLLWRAWPRPLIRLLGNRFGTAMMIEATR